MQTIYPTSLTPEQYSEQEYHKQVRPPENCPNCQRPRLGSAGLLSPLHHHRHSAGLNDLGAAVPLPALSRERELSAGLCPTLSTG